MIEREMLDEALDHGALAARKIMGPGHSEEFSPEGREGRTAVDPSGDPEDWNVAREDEGDEIPEQRLDLRQELRRGRLCPRSSRPVPTRLVAVPEVIRRQREHVLEGREVARQVLDGSRAVLRPLHQACGRSGRRKAVGAGQQPRVGRRGVVAGTVEEAARAEGVVGDAHPPSRQEQDGIAAPDKVERRPGVFPRHGSEKFRHSVSGLAVGVADHHRRAFGAPVDFDGGFRVEPDYKVFAPLRGPRGATETGAGAGFGPIVRMVA